MTKVGRARALGLGDAKWRGAWGDLPNRSPAAKRSAALSLICRMDSLNAAITISSAMMARGDSTDRQATAAERRQSADRDRLRDGPEFRTRVHGLSTAADTGKANRTATKGGRRTSARGDPREWLIAGQVGRCFIPCCKDPAARKLSTQRKKSLTSSIRGATTRALATGRRLLQRYRAVRYLG